MVYDLCKVKTVCEGGDELEMDRPPAASENIEDTERKKVIASWKIDCNVIFSLYLENLSDFL